MRGTSAVIRELFRGMTKGWTASLGKIREKTRPRYLPALDAKKEALESWEISYISAWNPIKYPQQKPATAGVVHST